MTAASRARALVLGSGVGAVALLAPAAALADDCVPASGFSSCFEANSLWWSAGQTPFAGIAATSAVKRGALALAALVDYVDRPVVLNVPSPDPEGRDVNVVRGALGLSLAYAYGLTDRVELSVATPLVLYQTGAGAEGVTSQRAPPLSSAAVRDPRVGVGVAVVDDALSAKARTELVLPLGDERLFAGTGGFTLAPSLAGSARLGPLHAAAELGARLRRTVPFATASVGSQGFIALGAGANLWSRWLSLELEAYALPSLVAQAGRRDQTSRVHSGRLVPAEWLASVRSEPLPGQRLALSLGGGTALPLSSETRETAAGSSAEHFAGVTSPAFRMFFGLRYQP